MKKTIKNYWVTPEEILAQHPCNEWSETNVLNWFNGRKKVRLSTILNDEHIPEDDRCWIVESVIYMRPEIPCAWWVKNDEYEYNIDELFAAIE